MLARNLQWKGSAKKSVSRPVSMAIESYYRIGKERVKLLTGKYRRKGRSLFDD
ncbi:MAG: hypothetical protein M3136_01625 [Thermoproteota archaeon]|nr:hypothetical protein [Thermoproteota archaeon]